jgi:hypothetical protein
LCLLLGLSAVYTPSASATVIDDVNGGHFVGDAQPGSRPADRSPADAASAAAATSTCSGWFHHAVSNVYFYKVGARLFWDFYLTNAAQTFLGPTVTVSMPFAYINGRPINPPYAPHSRPSWYDFHSSIERYQYIGGGGGTIGRGQALTLYWWIAGSIPGRSADRYITCSIP